MPIKANAKKALRQSIKHTQRNKVALAEINSLRVKFRKLSEDKKAKEAKETASLISKKLDKAVARGIMEQNTAARYKSRTTKKANALAK